MKNLFGTANKGLGKLKGFIFGGNPSEESQQAQSSQENKQKENPPVSNTNIAGKPSQNQNPPTGKSPQKDEQKSNTVIKPSKGQFDFSDEDDDEESKPKKNQNESETTDVNFEYSEPEEDYWKIAHRLYLKNSMVDIEPLPSVPFIKIKKNDNILSLIGFGNKKPFREIKYFAVFDEHFLYMINMTQKDNNQNNFFKKIGNHYDLTKVSDIEIKDDEVLIGKKLIKIVFLIDDNSNFSTKTKEFHFEKNDAIKFFSILKFYLKKYGVPLIFKDENKEGEEKDEEEEEEEEDEEENENKDEENKDKDEENKDKDDKKDEEKKEEEKKEDNDKKEEEKKEEDKKEKEKKEEDKKEEEKKEEVKKEEEKNEEEKKEEEKKEENKEDNK
jgi:hypothetical protein